MAAMSADGSDDGEEAFFDAEEEFEAECEAAAPQPPPLEPLALHRAAWDASAAGAAALRRLAAAASPEELAALDTHGNSALHIAALRGNVAAIEALCDAGLKAGVKSSRGWRPIEEAISARSMPAALALHARMEAEAEAALAAKKALLLRTLGELPAFSLSLKWELGSSVPGAGRGPRGGGRTTSWQRRAFLFWAEDCCTRTARCCSRTRCRRPHRLTRGCRRRRRVRPSPPSLRPCAQA
jgi:hypothetical protein